MARTIAVTPLGSGKIPSEHHSRAFNAPPDISLAVLLLAELAAGRCAFTPVASDRPLALYGAGNMGRLARDFLAAVGYRPLMIVDRDARRQAHEPGWAGERLLSLEDAAALAKDNLRVAVSVVTSPYVPIERSLRRLGFNDIAPFYDLAESFRQVHPLSNGWFAAPPSTEDRANTSKVLTRWDDDLSRAHHLQFLAWRRLREEWTFAGAPIPACSRFFIPEVAGVLHGEEFLLDAGAHHGSVLQVFMQQTKGAYRGIAAIEPDPANRARLKANLQSRLPDDPRITVYECALADVEGQSLFHDGLDYASQLSPTGRIGVETRPLDALGLAPTFVKLHLEGAELAALRGARETLLANRPIVAATVYHNADGIWKTPLWLMQTLLDYRFLFRAHSWCGTGAVVYAIPKERRAS